MADVKCDIESCVHNIDKVCFANEITLCGCTPDADNVVACQQFKEYSGS